MRAKVAGIAFFLKNNIDLLKIGTGRGSKNHLHKGEALKSTSLKIGGFSSHWLKHDERNGIQHSSLPVDNKTTMALKAWHSNSIVKAAAAWEKEKDTRGKKKTCLLFCTPWELKTHLIMSPIRNKPTVTKTSIADTWCMLKLQKKKSGSNYAKWWLICDAMKTIKIYKRGVKVKTSCCFQPRPWQSILIPKERAVLILQWMTVNNRDYHIMLCTIYLWRDKPITFSWSEKEYTVYTKELCMFTDTTAGFYTWTAM